MHCSPTIVPTIIPALNISTFCAVLCANSVTTQQYTYDDTVCMTQYVDFIAVQNHFTAHLRVEQRVSGKECFYIRPFAHYLLLHLYHCN